MSWPTKECTQAMASSVLMPWVVCIIAFPRNKAAQNPMDGSPAEIDARQMKEAGIRLGIGKKK